VAFSSEVEAVASVLGASTANETLFWLDLKSHCKVVQTEKSSPYGLSSIMLRVYGVFFSNYHPKFFLANCLNRELRRGTTMIISPAELNITAKGICPMMSMLGSSASNTVSIRDVTITNIPAILIPANTLLHRNLLFFHSLLRNSPNIAVGTTMTDRAVTSKTLYAEKKDISFKLIPK